MQRRGSNPSVLSSALTNQNGGLFRRSVWRAPSIAGRAPGLALVPSAALLSQLNLQSRDFHVGRGLPRTASRLFDVPASPAQSLSTTTTTATTSSDANSDSPLPPSPDHQPPPTPPYNYLQQRRILHQDEYVTKVLTTVAQSRGAPVDLYHELHGHGSHKVLFITGWAGSCDNWRFQTEFFGRHGDFEVCIYENRGSGFSSTPDSGFEMRDMALDAVELLDQLGWEKAHVVGVSMGGMIAQELALLAPSRVDSLTLTSTTASRALPPMKHIPWLFSSFTKILLGLAKPKNLMPFFLYSRRWLNLPAPENSGYTSNLEYMLGFHGGRIDSRPPQSFISAIKQMRGMLAFNISKERLMDLKNYFLRSKIPAMVVHGTEDALVHLRTSWNLAKMLGARLVVFEGRGHALNHEDIELFNRLLLRHFYTAILGAPRRVEAEARAGWWLTAGAGVVDNMEQRAMAMVKKATRQMVGFSEWLWSFFFTRVEGKPGMEVEWLPPVVTAAPVPTDVTAAVVVGSAADVTTTSAVTSEKK
ncbi:alpha/beta-hydrolase [Rhizoclosmatium globosum]|uniref:Alpha/beta-hydrolase n=1 Tax=Rhizoclosmatium globosum TaxID=329046 RepID=A0A1Y2CJ11_9FUNG|nr:alpha/beta-hydrolase [Rhizoclosmatium globosum]|eukprot:ORY46824.1 alpha/beta-hydrolase [Rhizoclosmatium globosum]